MKRGFFAIGVTCTLALFGNAALAEGDPAIRDAPLVSTPALGAGDPVKGGQYFSDLAIGGCSVCHPLESGKKWIGSSLYRIFGRKAGAMEGFVYSKAMRESGIVWDEESIDLLMQNPRVFLSGTRMYFRGLPGEPYAQVRRDIIAYLKQATR
jgi:cytochrome c